MMRQVLDAYGVEYAEKRSSFGGDWQAVKCPFHDDSRASASVSLKRSFFRCHACDVSGNPIRIVALDKSMTSAEAVQWILSRS